MVLHNGCDDTQISFQNGITSGYVNPNAPSDGSCNVFDPRGGGVIWKREIANSATTGSNRCFLGYYSQPGVGNFTTDPSLIMYQPVNSADVCNEINNILGIPEAIQANDYMGGTTNCVFLNSALLEHITLVRL